MDQEKSPRPQRSRGRVVAASVTAALVLVAGAFSIGRLSAPATPAPGTTSNEAGFARDMQVHHEQAVDMSFIVRDETDDTEVRLFAYDIARTQSQQEGQLYGWLAAWHLPQASPEAPMTWMARPALTGGDAHAGMGTAVPVAGAAMPGYATDEQMTKLKSLTGEAAATFYLQLMIAHHRGGVEMAEAIEERSTDPVVLDFASGVIASQTADIDAMQDMLDARS